MKKTNKEKFYEYLEQIKGTNLAKFAKETGLSKTRLYNILTGKCCPSYSTIRTSVDKLEMTVDDFVETFFPYIEFKQEPQEKKCSACMKTIK